MDLGLNEIWFHDSQIHRVVEDPLADELRFEVMHPEDWENNLFVPRTIVFSDVLGYTTSEGPFAGRPTILSVTQTGDEDGRAMILIETNAGDRRLLCAGVSLRDGWAA